MKRIVVIVIEPFSRIWDLIIQHERRLGIQAGMYNNTLTKKVNHFDWQMPLLSGKTFIGCPLSMYEDTTPTTISKCIMWSMLIGSKLKALKSLTNLFHCKFMSNMLVYPFLLDGQVEYHHESISPNHNNSHLAGSWEFWISHMPTRTVYSPHYTPSSGTPKDREKVKTHCQLCLSIINHRNTYNKICSMSNGNVINNDSIKYSSYC